jgi:hypothetical protein
MPAKRVQMLALRAGSRWRGGIHPPGDPRTLGKTTRRERGLSLRHRGAPNDLDGVLLWDPQRSILPCPHDRLGQADFGGKLAGRKTEHRAGARQILGGHAVGGGGHEQNIIPWRNAAHPRAHLTQGMTRAHPVST